MVYILSCYILKNIFGLPGYLFAIFAVVLWAFGVCGLRYSRHSRNYWKGSLWWPGLCEACIDIVHWFGCNLCANSYYNGELDQFLLVFFLFCFLPLNWYSQGSYPFTVEEFIWEKWEEEEKERLVGWPTDSSSGFSTVI